MAKVSNHSLEAFEADLKRKVPALEQQEKRAAVAEAFAGDTLKRLRAARRSANLTQTQVAERMGVDQSFVAKLEGGKAEMTLFWLGRFCDALEVTPYFLMRQGSKVRLRARAARRAEGRKADLLQDVQEKIGEVLDIAGLLAEEGDEKEEAASSR